MLLDKIKQHNPIKNILETLHRVVDVNKRDMLYCIATGNWTINNKITQKTKLAGKMIHVGKQRHAATP